MTTKEEVWLRAWCEGHRAIIQSEDQYLPCGPDVMPLSDAERASLIADDCLAAFTKRFEPPFEGDDPLAVIGRPIRPPSPPPPRH